MENKVKLCPRQSNIPIFDHFFDILNELISQNIWQPTIKQVNWVFKKRTRLQTNVHDFHRGTVYKIALLTWVSGMLHVIVVESSQSFEQTSFLLTLKYKKTDRLRGTGLNSRLRHIHRWLRIIRGLTHASSRLPALKLQFKVKIEIKENIHILD